MKKIFLLAAMALFTLSASAQVKIAHVNFSELYQLTSDADAARSTMAAAQKEANETFQSMYEEFQTKYNEYQQKSSTWTPAIKENKEKELSEINNRLQEFQQSIQQELAQKEQQLYEPMDMRWSSIPRSISMPTTPSARISRPMPRKPLESLRTGPSSPCRKSFRHRLSSSNIIA